MVKQLSSSRTIPAAFMRTAPIWVAIILAVGAIGVGGTMNRADAQGVAEDALFPRTLRPAVSSIPASGAQIVLTVTVEDLLPGTSFNIQAIYDVSGPDLDAFAEILPEDLMTCPLGQILSAGQIWECSYRLSVGGGAPGSSEQHAVGLLGGYGSPGNPEGPSGSFGGVSGPVVIAYAATGSGVSYDPGPDGTVSWSQASGTVGVDVTTENGGKITVSGSPSGGQASEYFLMGQTIDITANGACTPGAPCTLVFRLVEPEAGNQGVTPENAVVLRNGDPVPECPGSSRCVDDRGRFGNGDIRLVVVTDQLSEWNTARPPSKNDCKKGGWRVLLSNGQPLRDQGDCVSHFATRG